ncbi:MAG: YcgN family cysteine cluster protein [Rickettsiales bacterium]|nr:YcgN family cysteine cluster protein [Rickettsiales bacterium]
MASQPAFLSKPMHEMSHAEWESLCDGCGLCCQIRLEDIDSGEITLSNAACRLLDLQTLQCSDYPNRKKRVSDCVKITPENVGNLNWLPNSCAYRMVWRGEPLEDWHYLICGDKERVHTDGPSMRGELIGEDDADWDEM